MRRQKIAWSAAGLISATALVAVTGTVVAQARTGSAGKSHSALTAADLPSCPSATICAFIGPDATGTQASFPTSANHSQWIDFDSVVGFHPDSIINNSESDIWVYDEENADSGNPIAGPYCAFGTSQRDYTFTDWVQNNLGTSSQSYSAESYQPGWFFIQYNVNTCATPTSSPPPS
jgi:hypothetical protein